MGRIFKIDANVSNNHENYDARAGAWNRYYNYVHTVEDKDYFGKIDSGTLELGTYTISLIPYGKKEASTKFVYSVQ